MYAFEANNPVIITQFKWAGDWGPFHIKSHCNECDLVTTVLRGMLERDLKGKNVILEVRAWLNNILFCLRRGAWHPPIIMVDGRMFFQFSHKKPMFDKEKLIQTVVFILEEKRRIIGFQETENVSEA